MNRQDYLNRRIQQEKMGFSLPKLVTSKRELLPDGKWAYVFRHQQLGELGRILLLPHGESETKFICEVAGDPEDPMTAQRQAILEPVTRDLLRRVGNVCGEGQPITMQPYLASVSTHLVKSEMMPCEVCGAATALLIYAPSVTTEDGLADYERLMYRQIKQYHVPTWIVGEEREVVVAGEKMGEALMMKVWPKRKKPARVVSKIFNAQLDELMETHC